MRDVRIDNIKGLLILLTVFGHALELTGAGISSPLYRMIYSFHMPAFIFISGYLAKWNPSKLLCRFLPLYLIAQLAYLIFDLLLIGARSPLPSEFLTPYWHLWYLFALMLYYLALPALSRLKDKHYPTVFVLALLLSLAFPLLKTNLYFLSLGRFFAFLPFFILGYFCGKSQMKLPNTVWLVPFSVIFTLTSKRVTVKMLYGSFAYSSISDIAVRALLLLFAFGWISLLFRISNKESILTFIGKNTLPIYILHGAVIKLLKIMRANIESEFTAFIISFIICISLACIKNPHKTVDTRDEKVYNNVKYERSFLPWILKQRSKRSQKRSRMIKTSPQSSKQSLSRP